MPPKTQMPPSFMMYDLFQGFNIPAEAIAPLGSESVLISALLISPLGYLGTTALLGGIKCNDPTPSEEVHNSI